MSWLFYYIILFLSKFGIQSYPSTTHKFGGDVHELQLLWCLLIIMTYHIICRTIPILLVMPHGLQLLSSSNIYDSWLEYIGMNKHVT